MCVVGGFLKACFFTVTLVVSVTMMFSIGRGVSEFVGGGTPLGTVMFSCCVGFVPCFSGLFDPLFIFVTIVFFASGLTRGSRVVTVFSAKVDFGQVVQPCVVSTTVVSIIAFKLKTCIVPGKGMAHLSFRSHCGGGGGRRCIQGIRLRMSDKIVTCVRHCRGCGGAKCHFSLSGFSSGGLITRLATQDIACSATSMRG